MSATVSESMARRIFELAVETGQSAVLLDLLFDGGSVTVDAQTGRLVMIPAEALARMADTEVPEWCTCREPEQPGETNEQTMAAALTPFGWTCGPEFWQRYYSDPWVFNLANAVERLSRRVEAT